MTAQVQTAWSGSRADAVSVDQVLQVEKSVFVSVGTDHHRFDRLVEWMDEWQAVRQVRDEVGVRPSLTCHVSVQYGTSQPPSSASGRSLMPHDELQAAMAGASAIVTHGGPATIRDSLAAGLRPLVVPRDPQFGEHVDDHQIRFTRMLDELGEVVVCRDKARLFAALDRAMDDDSWLRTSDGSHMRDTSAAVARVGAILDEVIAFNPRGWRWRR